MSIDSYPGEPLYPDYMIVTSTTRPTFPTEGQVIYETDTNAVRFWDGSGWRLLPGVKIGASWPSLVGSSATVDTPGIFMQGASYVVSTNASGDFTITYPVAFPNGLLSFMCWQGDNTHAGATYVPYLGGAALAYHNVRLYTSSGTVWANSGNMRVNWMALGW